MSSNGLSKEQDVAALGGSRPSETGSDATGSVGGVSSVGGD